MNETVKTEPCLEGLTPACFRTHPEYAKRLFAYRLLMLLIGEELLKRLQTIPFGIFERIIEPIPPFPVPPAPPTPPAPPAPPTPPAPPAPPVIVIPPFPPVPPPIYIPPWEPGPPTPPPPTIEGDIMPEILKAKIDIATAATHEIIAAVAGFKICISALAFTVAGETNLTLKSGTTAISGAMDFGGTNEPRGLTHGLADYPLKLTSGEAFQITSSAAVQVSGYVSYYLS